MSVVICKRQVGSLSAGIVNLLLLYVTQSICSAVVQFYPPFFSLPFLEVGQCMIMYHN